MALLQVENLEVCLELPEHSLTALEQISFTLGRGERLGIVGESGAGKSMLGFALLNLLAKPARIRSGKVHFDGRDLLSLPARELRKVRGNRIAMIFQDPMVTLNPSLTIGTQMMESLRAHRRISRADARRLALKKLEQVKLNDPEQLFEQYPYQLSVGMCQRVVIAISLLLEPDIVIADEPTTALDVTLQAEILQLLQELCDIHHLALIIISHDLAVVAQVTQRLLVMYAGRIVEQGPTRELINDAQHPYTQGLMNALPQLTLPGERLRQIPGNLPTLLNLPSGCAFHPRCAYRLSACTQSQPGFTQVGGCQVACHMVAQAWAEPGEDAL